MITYNSLGIFWCSLLECNNFFYCQMWFLKLLLILAFANACMTVRGHRYTNTWIVQISGDINEVKRIAEKDGFTYKTKVSTQSTQ